LINELHLKTATQVASALAYHTEKENIHSKGILMLRSNRTLCEGSDFSILSPQSFLRPGIKPSKKPAQDESFMIPGMN
jgi:hypothetical protein